MHTNDFPTSMGPVGICLRLKRLADQMSQDARRLYAEIGLDIEPGWHAIILLLLDSPQGLGVAQIARALGISQPSASATVKQMLKRGYIEAEPDPADGRRKIVCLTPYTHRQLPRLHEVWGAFQASMQEVIDATGSDFMEAVAAMETELQRRSTDHRVMDRLKHRR